MFVTQINGTAFISLCFFIFIGAFVFAVLIDPSPTDGSAWSVGVYSFPEEGLLSGWDWVFYILVGSSPTSTTLACVFTHSHWNGSCPYLLQTWHGLLVPDFLFVFVSTLERGITLQSAEKCPDWWHQKHKPSLRLHVEMVCRMHLQNMHCKFELAATLILLNLPTYSVFPMWPLGPLLESTVP